MKSQSKSQSSKSELVTAGEILDWYFWSLDKAKDENLTYLREAKAALHQLVLSCLPEKYTEDEITRMLPSSVGKALLHNSTIAMIEANIRAKFG